MGKRPDGCERLEAEARGEKKENMQASEEIPRQGRGHGAEPESHSFPGRGPSDLTFVPSTVDSDPAASLFAVPQGVVAGILATAGLRAVRLQRRGRPDIRVTFSPQESGWGNSQVQGSAAPFRPEHRRLRAWTAFGDNLPLAEAVSTLQTSRAASTPLPKGAGGPG
jgi:hypothetical protein